MKYRLLSLLMFISCFSAFAQEIEFGTLQSTDLEIKECSFEKDAPAVVLFDKGKTWFAQDDRGFILRFDRHVRIKIFDEAAFDQGDFEIPLYHSNGKREEVKDIEGFTFNIEEGKVEKTPLKAESVYKEEINEYWYSKKFAMPKIKEGSIIDVKYTIYSPYFSFLRDWEFQTDIPTIYSEYKVQMIPFYSYRYRLQGATKVDHFKSYEKKGLGRSFIGIEFTDMVYEFGLKNVPSFKDEDFISSRNDYVKKIDFQLAEINEPSGYKRKIMDSWSSLSKELLDSPEFGKYIKKAEKWGDKNMAYLKEKSEAERLNAVLDYMKMTYKWDQYYGKYARITFKEFNSKLTGNIGNINLATIGILRSLDLEAEPVIISTRNNGKVNDAFPYAQLFNYVLALVEVDGKKRLVDATMDLCSNSLIPSKCINGKGFVVDEDNDSWVSISNSAISMEEINLIMNINTDEGELEGLCKTKCTGYKALSERIDYHRDQDDFKEQLSKKGLEIASDIMVDNMSEKAKPFKYSYEFTSEFDQIDDQLIISPFVNLPSQENPFKQEERQLPVDLVYRRGNRYIATIQIPDGYKVDELPGAKNINSDNVSFNYKAVVNDKMIQIIAAFNFKKQSYEARDYKELKNFMNAVTSKVNSKIILSKKEDLAGL
jgi:hypothetical protein